MSASSTPTLWPNDDIATARLTVSEDLPTPPFPDATAMTRVVGSSWIALSSAGRPPRSFDVSAARSSGVITSKSRRTDPTPSSPPTSFATWSWNDERSGQPATVSAILTLTSAPATVTSRTMSSSVTGLRSSGSITLPSAARTASRVGIGTERSALEEPGVHLRDAALGERQVSVFRRQPRLDTGDVLGQPDAVAERDELVLLALPEQDGNADRRDVEAPRLHEHEVVVEPAVAAGLDPGTHVFEQLRGELAGRHLAIRGPEQCLPLLDELLGKHREQRLALPLHRRAVCLVAFEDDGEL